MHLGCYSAHISKRNESITVTCDTLGAEIHARKINENSFDAVVILHCILPLIVTHHNCSYQNFTNKMLPQTIYCAFNA